MESLTPKCCIVPPQVCLRHGLDRSEDISNSITFGKISHLLELLGREERWPDRLFSGRCDGGVGCQCEGVGKGCRRKRLLKVFAPYFLSFSRDYTRFLGKA